MEFHTGIPDFNLPIYNGRLTLQITFYSELKVIREQFYYAEKY